MTRPSTTDRGYGWQHQQAVKRLRNAHIDGTICPRHNSDPLCVGPMYLNDPGNPLDGGHSVDLHVDPHHIADRLEHSACNRRAGAAITNNRQACPWHTDCGSFHSSAWGWTSAPSTTTRRVILICGPPGSGKTTLAHSLGLTVYDLDDPQWGNSEATFTAALSQIGDDPDAQATVIRSGATRSARARAREIVGATETMVLTEDVATCTTRVLARKRPRPAMKVQLAAIKTWWDKYEPER